MALRRYSSAPLAAKAAARQPEQVDPTTSLQVELVVGSTLIFSITLLDSLFGAIGEVLQFVFFAAAIYAFRSFILRALSDKKCLATVLFVILIAVIGLSVGDRLSYAVPTVEFGLRLILFSSFSTVLGVILATTPEVRPSFVTGIAIAAAISGISIAFGLVPDVGHIEAARSVAPGLAVLPFLPSFKSQSLVTKFALAGFLAIVAFQTGARAPLLAALIAIALVLLLALPNDRARQREANRWRFLAVSVVGLVAIGFASGHIELDTLEGKSARQVELLEARSLNDIASFRDRMENFYTPALEIIENNLLLGRGLPADISDNDNGIASYPHNFVLEMGVGLGLFGLFAAVGMLTLALRGAWRSLRTDPAISSLIVYALLSAQISDDLVGNRLVFFAAAFGLFRHRYRALPSRV